MPTLVAVDAVGIQRFVFASNRLRDAVGASDLVEWAVSPEALDLDPLFAAGGNAVLQFASRDAAKAWTAAYTRRLLEKAPGLEMAVAHRYYEKGALARALRALLQVDLARAKTERRPSVPLLGLGVTAVCRETGQPAVALAQPPEQVPISCLVEAARGRLELSNQRWRRELIGGWKTPDGRPLRFPLELDHLGGTKHTRSLLGVVHVDGNGVGGRIRDWLHSREGAPDARVAKELREWSQALTKRAEGALKAVTRRVIGALILADGKVEVGGKLRALDFALDSKDGHVFLPLRPILLGGDDVTFVCDGRLALDLAVTAATEMAGEVPHLGAVSACAGVAVVPLQTPFVRAYQLSDALCQSAKRERQRRGWKGGVIDWHVGTVRPGESVDVLRLSQFATQDTLSLTCRPYPLMEGQLTWSWLRETLLGDGPTGLRGPYWADRHGKVRRLADIAREGPGAVERALRAWQVSERRLALPSLIPYGFFEKHTPLVDAVELLDRAQVLVPAGALASVGGEAR